MIVLTDGKDASIAYCLTTALFCPLPGQYLAIARHKTIRRERKNPHSLFYSSLFTKSAETPLNTGVSRGEEWRTTLHLSSPLFTWIFYSSDYAELTEHSCSTDASRKKGRFKINIRPPADFHLHNRCWASAYQLLCKRTTAVVRLER